MATNDSSARDQNPEAQSGEIRVMLVDDSAVIRGILTKLLAKDPGIKVVSSVSNGEHALSSAKSHNPDIIILDIEMPVMDGLTALPKLLEICPDTKVIMFSSLTEKGASVTLEALALGAVECVVKPASTEQAGEGTEFQENLLKLIRGLAESAEQIPVKVKKKDQAEDERTAEDTKPAHTITLRDGPDIYKGKPSIIAIGSSTGGPQALFELMKCLQGLDVPVLITQHMPATFTRILAEHITQNAGVPCYEGQEGMAVEKGHAYVAPGGYHMTIINNDGKLSIALNEGPPENFCKPSVDPMMRSALEIFGNKVLGIILTGMGHDGLSGAKLLAEKGGRLIAQDEATSVVWGMPGAVAQAGLCTEIFPLPEIGPWIRKQLAG